MTDRTTVWYLVPALVFGGTERTLVDLANSLDPERFDVTVWTIFDQNPLADDLAPDVTLRTLNVSPKETSGETRYPEAATNPTEYVSAPLRFVGRVRRERPDVLQSFLFFDNVIARLAGVVSPSTTVVCGVREVNTDMPTVREVVERATISLADHTVSNSRAGAELAVDRGAPRGRVSVVWNGRDARRYRSGDPTRPRTELGLPADAPIVGTVGRLVERKGHHDLLGAWPTVLEHDPTARLVFVGDGPRRPALEAQAAELGCTDSVTFAGTRDDVPSLLALFDVFVFPSHYEGLPGALIEAMAAGLPIVTTPVDGAGELVENYRHGLHVETHAPAEIAWATNRLLQNPPLARAVGTAARDRAETECTVDGMTAQFEALYDRLCR